MDAEAIVDQMPLGSRVWWFFLLVLAKVPVLPEERKDNAAGDVPCQEDAAVVLLPSMLERKVESEECLVPRDWSVEYGSPLLEDGSPKSDAVLALPEEVVIAFDVAAAVCTVPQSLVALAPEEVVNWKHAPPYSYSHI